MSREPKYPIGTAVTWIRCCCAPLVGQWGIVEDYRDGVYYVRIKSGKCAGQVWTWLGDEWLRPKEEEQA